MPRRATVLQVSVLLVTLVALAGCGGDRPARDSSDAAATRDETYESVVSEIHREMNAAMSAAFSSRELDAQRVRAARTTATESLRRMEEATVPVDFRTAHAEYTTGLDTFAAILADVEDQVDEPDVARRHLGDKRFSTGVAHLERATKLYRDAGLDLDAGADST